MDITRNTYSQGIKTFIFIIVSLAFTHSKLISQEGGRTLSQYQNAIILAVGNFTPTTGTGGLFIQAGYYYETNPGLYIGADLEYSAFKSTVFSVDNVGITSVGVSTKVKYLLTKDKINPYIGAGLGYATKIINESDVQAGRPNLILTSSSATSILVQGLVGAMGTLSDNLNAVVEARYSYDWMRTKLGSNDEWLNMGGITLMGGIQILF